MTRSLLLIDPPAVYDGLNTGLAYLAAIAIEAGWSVEVLDLNNESSPRQVLQSHETVPDVVGISVGSFSINSAVSVAREVKRRFPYSFFIASGPHISLEGPEFLSMHDFCDAIIWGEGEEPLRCFLGGLSPELIPRLILRNTHKNSKGKPTSLQPVIPLDDLPFPRYDVFSSVRASLSVISSYPLVTSRGCPFACSFCISGRLFGREWRARSGPNVIAELKQAVKRYRIQSFHINDDNFALDMSRAMECCEALCSLALD